jgi:hypothetical protein
MNAQLTEIKGGWAAVGRGWAVFGGTREEALERYRQAEAKRVEIMRREVTSDPTEPQPPSAQSPLDVPG